LQQEINNLLELQTLDLEIRTLTLSQQELPVSLEQVEAQRTQIQESLAAKKTRLEELQQNQRHLDSEVALLIEGISRSRQRLMEIKDNIEYKAMLREIAFKEDRKDQMETELLQVLDAIEQQKAEVARDEEALQVLDQDLDRQKAEIAAEMAQLDGKIGAMNQDRGKLLSAIKPSLLKKYDFIRDKRQGVAVAEVCQGVCQACHMNIPPQQFIELQKEIEILTCPHCQRIIYWLPPAEANNGSEAHAA
jgi:hypothetical protein